MSEPFFSIIIPCLNEEKFLPRLLKNIGRQKYHNFEVVVVDGKSEDKTVEKASEFAKDFDLKVITANKRNVSFQRNLGAKKAKGEYLIFFDADTQIPSDFLADIRDIISEKKIDILNSIIKPDTTLDKDKAIATSINFLFKATALLNFPTLFGAMTVFKKSVFDKVGGYDEDMKFGEDCDIVRRAVKKGFKYYITKRTFYRYSLRRFRTEGTMQLVRKSALLNLNMWLKNERLSNLVDYPMGGHLFDKKTATNISKLSIKKFIDRLKEEFKVQN